MRRILASVPALFLVLALQSPAAAAVWETPPPEEDPPSEFNVELPPPDLYYQMDPNWDWRAPTYPINFGGGNGLVNVPSPFWIPLEGLEAQDYEPTDGWVLMAKNFGDATTVVNTPFLILYNKYRGTIRLLVFITSALHENYTWGRVQMRFSNSTSRTRNLNNRAIQLPLSRHPFEFPTAIINLQDGWNYADFTVGYDPNVGNVQGPMFIFEIDGISVNTINLEGESQTTTVSMGVTDLPSPALHTLQQLTGGFNKASKNFTSSQKFIDQLVATYNKSKDNAFKAKLQGIINELTAGKFPIGLVAGLVGFAEGFLGVKRPNNTPTVTTSISHIKLQGTMQADEQITSIPVRVPGANHMGLTNALPIWDYPLGIFAILNEPPTTYRTSSSSYHQDFINNPCVPCGSYYSYFDAMDILHAEAPLQYAVNTSFPGALTPRSIEAAWSFSIPHPKPEGSPGRWGQTPPVYVNWVTNLVNQGRYVMIGSADPHSMKYYEYRTQFVDIAQFHTFRPEVPRTFLYTEPYFTLQSGITPPVQVRVRLQKPGGGPNDDVILSQSYDLWWPSTSPFGQPPNWNPGTLAPVWKDPVAPVQTVLTPAVGQKIARGAPWNVTWQVQAGSIDKTEIALSTDNGASYPLLLGTSLDNSGTMAMPAINTNGTNYRVRVRTINTPAVADDVSDGPFTVWGVEDASVDGSVASVCVNGATKARVQAYWNTSVVTNGTDYIRIWGPSGWFHLASVSPSNPNSAHFLMAHVTCEPGTYTYQVGSVLDGAESWGPLKTLSLSQCNTCSGGGGGGCHGCQFEEGAPSMPPFFLRVLARAGRKSVIQFGVPETGPVQLELFDVRGRRVAELVNGEWTAGPHSIEWDGTGASGTRLGPGVYFARFASGEQTATSRFVHLR